MLVGGLHAGLGGHIDHAGLDCLPPLVLKLQHGEELLEGRCRFSVLLGVDLVVKVVETHGVLNVAPDVAVTRLVQPLGLSGGILHSLNHSVN